MSSKQRLALIAAALAVAVIAFVVLNPGNDDDGKSDSTEAVEMAPDRNAPDDDQQPAETATTERPARPAVERIAVSGGQVEGGVRMITVEKGDPVRIVITSDAPDDLHLHGYDIEKTAAPGQPARFDFKASLEGVFELESHTAEDQGLPPAVAKLVVEPS